MIQHGLALAVHDDAHIGDTGVDHGGQHKVDDPVIPRKGDGAVDAVGDQLPQIRLLFVGKDDPVHSFHGRTSLPLPPSIIFGSTTPPSGTVVWGPSTAMPQWSKSTLPGAPPTTACFPTWQPSPTMA